MAIEDEKVGERQEQRVRKVRGLGTRRYMNGNRRWEGWENEIAKSGPGGSRIPNSPSHRNVRELGTGRYMDGNRRGLGKGKRKSWNRRKKYWGQEGERAGGKKEQGWGQEGRR